MTDEKPTEQKEEQAKERTTGKSADLLSAELGGCIKFPIEAMPKVLQPLIVQGAEAMQCPPDYIGVPLLTTCGAAIGRTHIIKVKDGWYEITALWTAILGVTGTIKSPPHDLATKGNQEIQREWLEEFKQDWVTYRSVLKLSKEQGFEEPKKPLLKRITVSDTTVEALGPVMRDNPRGIILIRDEMSGWMDSMNQYKGGKGSDYQFYLTAWSGGPWQIDRKNLDAPIIIPHTYLAVTGTVIPEVLQRLLNREHQIDGFAARLLISYPPEVDEQWSDKGVEDSIKGPVVELQKKLSHLGFQEGKKNKPNILQFSKKGYEAFREVIVDHLEQKKRYGLEEALLAHWAKMKGYAARLSLIVHLIRYHSGETSSKRVDRESVYMAAVLIDYFKAHIARFYGELQQIQAAALHEQIIRWANKNNKQEILTREVYTARITPNAETTRAVLDDMANRGLGKWDDSEIKRKFILALTQQSATQQNQQETPSVGNSSKWLDKLRELRLENCQRGRVFKRILRVLLNKKVAGGQEQSRFPKKDEGVVGGS